MFDPSIIFQRTHAGRDEIQQKSHGLTQSERLVLIMVDGASTYREVRNKLPVLTEERFERALSNLQKKELILEVFMPIEGQAAEELERTVIDRFLQQDPMDPVTIILRDPEDELGFLSQRSGPPPVNPGKPGATAELPDDVVPTLTIAATESAMDAFHNQLADELSRELKARHQARPAPVHPLPEPRPPVRQPDYFPIPDEEKAREAPHWGYWLIAIGCAFIAGYVLAQIG